LGSFSSTKGWAIFTPNKQINTWMPKQF
jgi:hypothetical protein